MAEDDLRTVNVVWLRLTPKMQEGLCLGRREQVRPTRASLRKRARLDPFKPRCACGSVDH